jgi:hypothetical protein
MNIEHISSQNAKDQVDVTHKGMMGNLILVDEEVNNKSLRSKNFSSKKEIMKKFKVPLDPVLQKASEWTEDQIMERTKKMASCAHSELFKI